MLSQREAVASNALCEPEYESCLLNISENSSSPAKQLSEVLKHKNSIQTLPL